VRRSNQIAEQIKAVREFRDAYEEYLNNNRPAREVGELSGPAALASEDAGVGVMLPPALGKDVVNPIRSWARASDGTTPLRPKHVFESCDQSIGILSARLDEARAQERSLAGWVARVIRFPYDVREAAGVPPESRAGKVAFSVAVLVQAASTVLAGGIVWLLARVANALI
jgi:hypothetical protein